MRFVWYPALIGLYLVVVQWNERTGASAHTIHDLAGSAGLATLTAIAGWLVAIPLTEERQRRALIALLLVLWAGLFLSFQVAFERVAPDVLSAPLPALVFWTLLIALLGALVARGKGPLDSLTRTLGIASIVMLAFGAATLLTKDRGPVTAAPAPGGREPVDRRRPERPDIYVLVLDKYTSGAWLSANYGYDHRPFEDSLRAMGFVVPRDAPAPYAHTMLSLTSILEGRFVHEAPEGDLYARVERATIWPRLQAIGYRYAFIPSTFGGTRISAPADILLRAPSETRGTPGETWWVNSPLWVLGPVGCRLLPCDHSIATLMPYPIERGEELEWKLGTLATLVDSAGPIVAFAHLLTPHEPFLFDEDCTPSRPWWQRSDLSPGMDDRLRVAYPHQVRCLDRLLLRAVTTIVERSIVPPIILISGDHGHGRITRDMAHNQTLGIDEMTPAQLGERLSVFSAYRVPGAAEVIPDDFSPVNMLRFGLGPLLGATGPLSPPRAFWSAYETPLDVTEVPLSSLRPPAPRDTTP